MPNPITLSEKTADPNPYIQFDKWYREHSDSGIVIPNSVSLGTSSADGRVSVRTVLMKDYSETGFVFFTNYNSKKGSQLSSNPRAALLFYWPESGRQVRVEGFTKKLSDKDSESYFNTRPRESQLGAWASNQSSVISDRGYLENKFEHYKNKFFDKPVPRPVYWGGYCLVPDWIEFWQNGEFRLHDRIIYTKRKDIWNIERLAP